MSAHAVTHHGRSTSRVCPWLLPGGGFLFPQSQILSEQGGGPQVGLPPGTLALCRASPVLSEVSSLNPDALACGSAGQDHPPKHPKTKPMFQSRSTPPCPAYARRSWPPAGPVYPQPPVHCTCSSELSTPPIKTRNSAKKSSINSSATHAIAAPPRPTTTQWAWALPFQ